MSSYTDAVKNIVVPIPTLKRYPHCDSYVYDFTCLKDALVFFQAKAGSRQEENIVSLFLHAYTNPKNISVIVHYPK